MIAELVRFFKIFQADNCEYEVVLKSEETKVIYHCLRCFENVDWAKLRSQKELLVEALMNKQVHSDLEGIVNFLDTIQDNIVAGGIASEFEVFEEC